MPARPRYAKAMNRNPRLVTAILLGLMVAAALGRADLGADTEAPVLWSRAFQVAVVPAAALGWLAAPIFGRAGLAGWALAGATTLALCGLVATLTALALGQGAFALLPRHPLGLGALAFGAAAAQGLALRRQSRK